MLLSHKKVCMCACHLKGSDIQHTYSCCEYSYHKYINEDGTVDKEYYEKMIMATTKNKNSKNNNYKI